MKLTIPPVSYSDSDSNVVINNISASFPIITLLETICFYRHYRALIRSSAKPHNQANNEIKLPSCSSGKHVCEMFIPVNPHFYIAKLGYAGVYMYLFFIFAPKDKLWVLVGTPLAEAVLMCTHNLCFEQK